LNLFSSGVLERTSAILLDVAIAVAVAENAVQMLRQNDRRINLKRMPLHHIPKRSPQQPNILRLTQKRSPMMRHQRKKIGAA
jgi:hypothetical protein